MSYINADDVLPNILVKEIQKYVDGQLIYIPRKNENLLSWGEKVVLNSISIECSDFREHLSRETNALYH